MGLLDFLRSKNETEKEIKIGAPVSGRYLLLAEVPDTIFAQGILGPGCGFQPAEGAVYAPASGVISTIAETKHAVGITAAEGEELLIHIGMDTVKLNGKGFSVKVKEGQKVNAGDILLTFDMDAILKAGYELTSVMVVTNSSSFAGASFETDKNLEHGAICGKISR